MNERLWRMFIGECRKLLEIWQREYQTKQDREIIANRLAWLQSIYDETREYVQ